MNVFGRDLSQPKTFLAGAHRACPPRTTLERIGPVGARVGVTRLANVTGLDSIGVPVWVAIRPNAKGLATSQGKGLTDEAAKASALMESIEAWHAENIDLPVRICDYDSITSIGQAVRPLSLSHYADAAPRADTALAWVEGFDLVSQAGCWTPLEAVSTDYTVDAYQRRSEVFVQSSNGLAGGNHPLEAIAHGLCELIERHAVASDVALLTGFDRACRLVLDSVDDPYCREVLARLERAGVLTAVWRLPTSFGLPVFAATIVDADERGRWRSLPPFNGYGCHLDPGVALARALTEAVQSRATFISGSRDDISAAEYARGGNADDLRHLRTRLQDGPGGLRFDGHDSAAGDSFEADVERIVAALTAAGHRQVIAVDLAKPEIGVPVVKMVVPGLAAPDLLIRGRPVQVPARANALEAA